ncbi:bestrophin-2 [Drosophila grimshawi]|uniref:Bestrophin homolog n=1 Tax=Drosophila grimshawi TaxID=7222 RepID=B4IZ21_DROGR|nr:bestrophin-2 [Drosophila grimshawi]EDV97729.1 GH17026 [Drosophila grimshawi]
MTVSYTAQVATCHRFGCFWKLLGRWRASIYKIIWADLLVFLIAFYAMALLYRTVLDDPTKLIFDDLVEYCRSYGGMIPLSFVLGFYVAIIVGRWWSQYITVPWPDPLAVYVSALVRGQDDHGRLMRRTIMRYVCLSLTMVLTMISPVIKRRFPTYDYLVEAGLLNKNEALIISKMDEKFPKHYKYWMPLMWASSIMTRARKEGRIWDDFSLKSMIDELNKFRGDCNMLTHYDMISVPLVYTQVVTLAVYTYFLAAIFGHQYINKVDCNIVNYYFPVFSTLEFFFFVGWLKVAETLICPFGDDDDDFELNWVIDRNLQVSYLIVDEMHNDHPTLVRDQYWDEVFPNELPYADESQRHAPPEASTAKLDLSKITSSLLPKQTPTTTSELDFTEFDGEDGDGDDGRELRIKFASRRFDIHVSSSSISFFDLNNLEPDNFPDEGDEEEQFFELPPTRETSKDDFDRLKEERERERHARQLQHATITFDLLKGELTNLSESGHLLPSNSPKSTAPPSELTDKSKMDDEVQTSKSFINERK